MELKRPLHLTCINSFVMNPVKHIDIPKPCHEQWQQMTTVSNGRYCGHCCKTVVDFSTMSNQEIITHLSGKKDVCGRFAPFQLHSINYALADQQRSWFKWSIVVAFFWGLTSYNKAGAKMVNVAVQVSKPPHSQKQQSIVADSVTKRVLKNGTLSNKSNRKTLAIDTLPSAHNNCNNSKQLQLINSSDTAINEIYNIEHSLTGFVGGISVRHSFTWRVWHKIKKMF